MNNGPPRRDLLIEYLHRIQDDRGYLGSGLLTALAEALKLSTGEVYEVASFYHHFDIVKDGDTPPPTLTIRVCDSISCNMAGAEKLIEELQAGLGSTVRIQRVPCVGRCETAPVAVVGTKPIPFAQSSRIYRTIDQGSYNDLIPHTALAYTTYLKLGGYQQLKTLVEADDETTREKIITTLENANLRGLGGAGFPTGRKWRIVRSFAGPRLMAVNIDEGEPGTFKDRYYLERNPHRFLEGMLIASHVVGIATIYIYLRDEYAGIRALLQQEIAALIKDPPCPLPNIELRRGAGAYICGEESAMIESIEGKRGVPRLRPPYIAEKGLFGLPTLAHNMETLYWVCELLEKGANWFSAHRRNGRHGLRSFSVSGRVKLPGMYLAPAGITLRELVDEYCEGMAEGHTLKAYFPGGASGGILPATLSDIPLDFDTLNEYGCFIGSAAIIVLSDQDSVREQALNAMKFFAHESCGQCTPCRVGTKKAAMLMNEKKWDQALLEELCQVMGDASICGLGQAAPNPLRCAMKYFPEEFG
ncbi:MAG: NADH-quinone oxidoreductase subunit F [Sedimenticola selenatireducens]|uniref:NADH-quinone oxidoreductase subunit F n=2 Tax=Sedimenticola selenatireducens TaxID=191960 RepID=A0A557SM59_9GAMM|nr:NADH-quinone oxidoreductase subunit F [Sedimenticola selenatireducens]TVT62830.1 MAG: NADH-quinone oxidoreductase subunit F [Sedimenticola selenatireducens]